MVFASAITSCFIPVFNEYLEKGGEQRGFGFAHAFITMLLTATALLTALGMVFAGPLVHVFGAGFDAATSELCRQLLVAMFPTVIFTAVAFAFVGILQSLGEFNIPAAISIVSNGVIIAYFFLFGDDFGVYGLAVAFLVGWLGQALVQLPSLKKRGYLYRPRPFLHEDGIQKVLLLMAPVMVSTWVQPINIAVATRFASHLYEGSGASAIQYANNLYTVLIGVIVLSITNVIFPKMAKLSAVDDEAGLTRIISVSVRSVNYILLPLTVGTMVMSGSLINLIYGGGEFNAFSLAITKSALFWLALGMLGYGVQAVLTRAFFAAQKGKTPLLAGACAIAVNVVSCAFFIKLMGLAGLALASSLSSVINAAFLWVPVQKRWGALWNKDLAMAYLKMVAAAVLMGGTLLILNHFFSVSAGAGTLLKLIVFFGETLVGVAIYFAATRIFNLDEAVLAFDLIGGKIHKK